MKLQMSLLNLDSSCLKTYWYISLKFGDTGYISPRLMLRFILKATVIVFEGFGSSCPKYNQILHNSRFNTQSRQV